MAEKECLLILCHFTATIIQIYPIFHAQLMSLNIWNPSFSEMGLGFGSHCVITAFGSLWGKAIPKINYHLGENKNDLLYVFSHNINWLSVEEK